MKMWRQGDVAFGEVDGVRVVFAVHGGVPELSVDAVHGFKLHQVEELRHVLFTMVCYMADPSTVRELPEQDLTALLASMSAEDRLALAKRLGVS